jgi:hypothetical protein
MMNPEMFLKAKNNHCCVRVLNIVDINIMFPVFIVVFMSPLLPDTLGGQVSGWLFRQFVNIVD